MNEAAAEKAMKAHSVPDAQRGVNLEVFVYGTGLDVVLVPSAMRGAADFAQLQQDLAQAGYRSLAVNPRCAGNSTGPLEGIDLKDIADDIALVVNTLCQGPAHLVGHALGNVGVRATASFRPEVARSVTVMPCGGHNLDLRPAPAPVIAALGRCHDLSLPENERLAALRMAFFAPGNDASVWLDGWWPQSAGIADAIYRTDPELWWRGGEGPMLYLMPCNDAMIDVTTGREIAAALGERARYVEINNCGHAILPEQGEEVARQLIAFFASLD
jgi:pimeloyl-ACP methyl ester carboxylesterase